MSAVKRMMVGLSLLLAGAGTASAQSVEVGEGDWSNIPRIELKTSPLVGTTAIQKMHGLAREDVCSVPGLGARRIDLKVPFMIRFTPEGGVERVVLKRLGCPQLEAILGGVVLQMAKGGAYRPAETNQERWYRSELNLASR